MSRYVNVAEFTINPDGPADEEPVELTIMDNDTSVEIRAYVKPDDSALGNHRRSSFLSADEAVEFATQLLEKARIAKRREEQS